MPRSRKARNMTGGTNSDSTWGVSCENIVSAVCTTYYGTNGTQPSLTDCDTQNIEFFADWNWKISQIIPVLLLKSSVVNKDLTFKAKAKDNNTALIIMTAYSSTILDILYYFVL